jgi:hypothetical protein
MWSVMKFYHQIRSGVTFKHSKENIIELWQNYTESEKSSSSDSLFSNKKPDNNCKSRKLLTPSRQTNKKAGKQSYTYIIDTFDIEEPDGNASDCELLEDSLDEDEEDSLLVVYDSNSATSLWQGWMSGYLLLF